MKSHKKVRILFVIVIFLSLIFISLYICMFHDCLSSYHNKWSEFGDYFAGTIGVLLSFASVCLLYYTLKEERKNRIDGMYQQYISNYYGLLNMINENWLHKENTKYHSGREIFGNAVRVINISNLVDEIKNQKYIEKNEWIINHINHIEKTKIKYGSDIFKCGFIYIYEVHANVFIHYCNYIVGYVEHTFKNNDLNETEKCKYINNLLSTISLFELIFFSYYIVFIYDGEYKNKIKSLLIIYTQFSEKVELSYLKDTHCEQIDYIIEKLKN